MIHPTAVIDPKADLADDVEVGPFTIIDAKVRIDSGTRIGPHAVITGRTTIGKNNHIFQFTSIGEQPQDKKYAGEDTELIIGDNNTIRELAVGVHRSVHTAGESCMQGRGSTTKDGGNTWAKEIHMGRLQLGGLTGRAHRGRKKGRRRVGSYREPRGA